MAVSVVSVGSTSTRVAKENVYRQKIQFVNNSDEDISISDSNVAVLGSGAVIKANGGSATYEPDTENWLYTGPWFAICTSGSKDLSVLEQSTPFARVNGFHVRR